MKIAKLLRKPTMAEPINLVQGGKGFLVYFPIYVEGEFEGFILAVFRIQEWLDYIFCVREWSEGLENYKVSVSIDDLTIFDQKGWDTIPLTHFKVVENIDILDHRFTVYYRPTTTFLENNSTLLDEVNAGIGFLLAILIGFIIPLFQRATTETLKTHFA